jgi:Mg-chelatase subunit ChlD
MTKSAEWLKAAQCDLERLEQMVAALPQDGKAPVTNMIEQARSLIVSLQLESRF